MRNQRLILGVSVAVAAVLGVGPEVARAGIDDLLGTQPGALTNGGSFADPELTCVTCHDQAALADAYSYLPFRSAAGTMMANAARDPVFFAALTVANQDAPGVGTFCLRCHSPVSFVREHATPADGSAFDEIDEQGVGCDACHRMIEDPFDDARPYLLGNAQIYYDDDTSKRGPYDDSVSPGHGTLFAPSLGEAAFCGQCHQVTNPDRFLRDAAGVETTTEFPLDTTYEEWAQSAFASGASAATCQDCHMIRQDGDLPVSNLFGSALRPDPRSHAFVGGNHWGIRAVMETNPDRATEHAESFQLALDETLAMLARSVEVTVAGVPATADPGSTVSATVRVRNLAGHKFPTGYAESRRAWIAVALVDPANDDERVVVGAFDATTGEIVDPDETRVYRAQHGRWNGTAGEAEEHLVLHDMVLLDTRIPPRGFVATPTTIPIGADYDDGQGGYVDFDEASFEVTLPAEWSGQVAVEARVYYQSMTKQYVEFLRDENVTDTRGDDLYAAFEATGEAAPLLIATASAEVDLGGEGGGGGGGPSSTTGAGGAAGEGGSTAAGGDDGGGDDDGCGCSVPGEAPRGVGGALAGALGLAWLAARRRRDPSKR